MTRGAILLGAGLLALTGGIAGNPGHVAATPSVAVDDAAVTEGMPRTLAEFGFFADASAQVPACQTKVSVVSARARPALAAIAVAATAADASRRVRVA